MRITIIALGSRGDVQPYIALAAGLQRAGHAVRLATHAEFQPLIDGRGIDFAEVRGNPREMLEGDAGAHDMLAAGENVLQFLFHFTRMLEPYFAQIVTDGIRTCAGADAIVLSNIGIIGGFHQFAEALGVPYCTALLQPVTPTAAFPSAFFPELPAWCPGRSHYNRLSHHVFLALFLRFFGRVMPMIRRELGLPPLPLREIVRRGEAEKAPVLYGFSPSVIPPPKDWPPHIDVTGYWFLDGPVGWQPSAEISAFLTAGPPPVYIGFGSMRNRDPEATTALVTEALARAGQRGILLTGWGGLQRGDLPESIFLLDSTSHEWLLPRMAAIVHHGGAGTTAAGLRAGVPSIVVPFFADQPFWARRVHQLGVGPHPIPRHALTATRLAEAITQAVSDNAMRARAAALGERIRGEDGVERAVEVITRYFMNHDGIV